MKPRQAIGVDIGGSNIRVALVEESGAIVARMAGGTPKTGEAIIAEIAGMIAAFSREPASAIGIGIPGRVDAKTGTIFSGGFVDLSGISLAEKLGRRAVIDNDANMALVGEARVGAAKGLANAVLLTIGTGIGGAVMESGRIIHGRATAGQLGHVTVDANGLTCLCGRRGCVETTSSGTALGRLLAAAGLDPATPIDVMLASDDEVVNGVLRQWAQPLRVAIDSLVAALDPERVVLGGGLGAAACRALERFPAASPWYQCEIMPASLGDDAGVIGAALASLKPLP